MIVAEHLIQKSQKSLFSTSYEISISTICGLVIGRINEQWSAFSRFNMSCLYIRLLETLVEISIAVKQTSVNAGTKRNGFMPGLNDDDIHSDMIIDLVKEQVSFSGNEALKVI